MTLLVNHFFSKDKKPLCNPKRIFVWKVHMTSKKEVHLPAQSKELLAAARDLVCIPPAVTKIVHLHKARMDKALL